MERALAPGFLRFRIRDASIPAMPEGVAPPPDTVIGAFVRNVEARIAELEKVPAGKGSAVAAARGAKAGGVAAAPVDSIPIEVGEPRSQAATPGQDAADELADLREVLRLGRHLLEGRPVTL